MTARVALLLALVCLARVADARELWRSQGGAVLEGSGFYKSFLNGLSLQPGAVQSGRTLSDLLDQARTGASAGTEVPAPVQIPSVGAFSAHLFRAGLRFRPSEKVEFEGAWQLALSMASDPVFLGGTLGGTVGGLGTSAQRRLVDFGSTIASGSSARLDQSLDRLSMKVALPIGDLTIGRQVLSWGTGKLWNPTDVLSPFPPTVIDREVRRGFDAVRLAVELGVVTQLDVLFLPQKEPADMGGVVRYRTNVKDWDWSVSLGKYVHDMVLGADFAGDVGALGVHGEGAYTLELAGLGTSSVSVGDRFFRGVVGVEARPSEKWLLLAEYAYNGFGATDPSRYASILTSDRVVRGEVFGAGRHQVGLAATYLMSDLATGQLATLVNVTDPSAMLIPSFERSLAQNVLLRAGANIPLGRGPDPHVYDQLTAQDVQTGSPAYQAASTTRGLRSEYGSSSFGAFVQLGVYLP